MNKWRFIVYPLAFMLMVLGAVYLRNLTDPVDGITKLDAHECILLQTHKQSLIADNLGKLIAAYQLGLVSKEKAIKIFQVLEQADLAPIEGC